MSVGTIHPIDIEQEMRSAYLDYAMSVIVARALPDARDGLKPVHRRILYAMHDMGMRSDSAYKKSARIVGEVLGKYHPHGDAAVYESMVRMAQNFSMRYQLVDGQGNFGSIDGDAAAAMRYTEARMHRIGEELLTDIQKDTVDFRDNFDGSLKEPGVLPAVLPNLIVNGASGIAVGMSTSIPPHNLGEVCDALVYMLSHWARADDISVEELMQFVQGPDFPTGGIVYGHKDADEDDTNTLVQAYATGRGKIIVRAKVHIEDMGRGKSRIIVSELPYQTNKTSLIERIASLVTRGQLEGLADLRDESDRQNQVRLVIELQRGADAMAVLQNLFKYTPLQETFSIIMLALVEGQPRLMPLRQVMRVFLEHRIVIVQRRSEYDLAQARDRAHILEGLILALNHLDEVIAIIRRSKTTETARQNLMKQFGLTERQANAILDLQLRRLASLERKKIEEEYKEKLRLITFLEGLLASPKKIRMVIAEELAVLKGKYDDPRRTIIAAGTDASSLSAGDFLTPEEQTWVTLTIQKRLARSYGNDQPKVTATDKEPPRVIVATSTTHTLYAITTAGQCVTIPVQQVPQAQTPADGTLISDLSPLAAGDHVAAMLDFPPGMQGGFLFMATTGGQVKRVRVEDLPGVSAKPFNVMNVGKDDSLGWAFLTNGAQDVVLATAQAQAIRFAETEVRTTGLAAGGMRGIKLLGQRDHVIGAFPAVDNRHVWSITNDGIAKSSPIEEYPAQGRAGGGVIAMRLPASSVKVAAATIGRLDDNIIALSSKGKAKYMRISLAPRIKRGRSGGESVIALRDGEDVVEVISFIPETKASDFPPTENGDREPPPVR
jgi:DNA gyrase subunit A